MPRAAPLAQYERRLGIDVLFGGCHRPATAMRSRVPISAMTRVLVAIRATTRSGAAMNGLLARIYCTAFARHLGQISTRDSNARRCRPWCLSSAHVTVDGKTTRPGDARRARIDASIACVARKQLPPHLDRRPTGGEVRRRGVRRLLSSRSHARMPSAWECVALSAGLRRRADRLFAVLHIALVGSQGRDDHLRAAWHHCNVVRC